MKKLNISETKVNVSIGAFSGPMDLLLSLVSQHKIDIWEISVSQIADEYLKHVTSIEWPDIEEAASFLVMAATLLYIKAKALLPQEKKESDEGEESTENVEMELLRNLVEYKRYKEASEFFRVQIDHWSCSFLRDTSSDLRLLERKQKFMGNPLEKTTAQDLMNAAIEAFESLEETFSAVPKVSIPIAEQMVSIMSSLKVRKRVSLSDFVEKDNLRDSKTSTLLAMLELIKINKLSASQTSMFGEIWMSALDNSGGEPA